jgi:Mce-associated membrane protein
VPAVVPVVLALLTLALVVGAAWTLVDVQKEREAQDRDAAALAAGREAAVAFTSYDYRHIDDDLDRVASRSTGDFRQQFTKALGALSAAIKKAHGVSRGEVSQAGLVRSSAESAVVMAAVDASITNRSTQGGSTRRYRLQITLALVDGDWLISDISPVA